MKENFLTRNLKAIFFCAAAVFINILLNRLVTVIGLPLFLDNVGTLLVAIMGGYLPGIIVGYVSNIINMISDPTNAYYAVLSVLIAVAGAWFAKKGYFEKIWKTLLTIPVFALIGGALGSILTYLMYGFGIGEGISAPFAQELLKNGTLNVFQAQMISDVVIDLADKAVTVLIVFLVLKLILPSFRESVNLTGWHQKPLTHAELTQTRKNETRKMSLQNKIILMVTLIMIFLAVVTTTISSLLYKKFATEQFERVGASAASLAALTVDGDKVEDFLKYGEKADGYLETERELQRIREENPHVQYLYVYQIQPDGCHVVFDLDTEEIKGNEPGDVIPFDESFEGVVPKLLVGKEIDPIVTNDTYGWLLTAYKPVYNSGGICVCYAAADIWMEDVTMSCLSFLTKVASLFIGFFILVLALTVWLANYHLIYPIDAITFCSRKFSYDSNEAMTISIQRLQSLKIKTGDEIEKLYEVLTTTMEATIGYIEDVEEKNAQIKRMQNGLIYVMADLVESRDKNTGDHIRKTVAYVKLLMRRMKEEGVYADKLTDEYMENVANSAPLHDVGKIKVSDVILNKPGKLTDEEFEIMKTHTTAGQGVIDRAMAMVPGSDFLQEAKNLASCHHEKWDGSGYPKGLKGEEIPLSARIMALADVFDALVSKRSYKEAFPFDKALNIIREGAGKHFDPQLAELFLNSEEELKAIAHKHEKELGLD